MDQLIIGCIFSLLFMFSLIVLEYFSRKINLNTEITRKIAHIESGLFGIFMAKNLPVNMFIFFLLLFQLLIIISYKINLLKSIHNVKRKTLGEIFLPLGILTAFIISRDAGRIFVSSILILTFADPLSGFFGNLKGFSAKTGNVLFFITAFAILCLFFPYESIFMITAVALLLTLVEKITVMGFDNLAIPLLSCLILKYFF